MRTEHRLIDGNILFALRYDRGEYDLVLDEENGGWYVETIIDSTTMRSKTYPCAQDADFAIKEKTVICNIPTDHV